MIPGRGVQNRTRRRCRSLRGLPDVIAPRMVSVARERLSPADAAASWPRRDLLFRFYSARQEGITGQHN